jgi:hypothetical protein
MIGGSHFTFGEREVFNHPQTIDYAVARRFSNRLHVRSGENIFSVSLPEKLSSTLILKSSE